MEIYFIIFSKFPPHSSRIEASNAAKASYHPHFDRSEVLASQTPGAHERVDHQHVRHQQQQQQQQPEVEVEAPHRYRTSEAKFRHINRNKAI